MNQLARAETEILPAYDAALALSAEQNGTAVYPLTGADNDNRALLERTKIGLIFSALIAGALLTVLWAGLLFWSLGWALGVW